MTDECLDADGDGLRDGREVGERDVSYELGGGYYHLQSDPTTRDTDSDGLDDETEVERWTVRVKTNNCNPNNDGCDPIKHDPDGRPMTVTSDQMARHSDGDGLTDKEEETLKTDPEKRVTYTATTEREQRLRQIAKSSETEALKMLGLPGAVSTTDPDEIELTDATDDFDFVTADDGDFTFRALDGRTRTDTWLSNHEELALGTDPYDPDYDDDFDALFRKVCRLRASQKRNK